MVAVDVDVGWSWYWLCDIRLHILSNYVQLIGHRLEIGRDIGRKISSFVFLCNYGQLIGCTPLIGRTLVYKQQLQ